MNKDQHELKHRDLTSKLIEVFYQVYNELGHGFLESVYERAMCIALQQAGLAIECQKNLVVYLRGQPVGEFQTDLIVERRVIIELKAARSLDTAHESQTLNYLKATDIEVGLLMNFGPKPEFKRFIFDNDRKASRPQPNPLP